jgi:hypothetical protein
MKSATEKPPDPGNEKAALAGGDLKANQCDKEVPQDAGNSSGNVLLNWHLTQSQKQSQETLV